MDIQNQNAGNEEFHVDWYIKHRTFASSSTLLLFLSQGRSIAFFMDDYSVRTYYYLLTTVSLFIGQPDLRAVVPLLVPSRFSLIHPQIKIV